ncbi:hypothetical protein KOW79_018866 [Hemibagrus wyckioides]|uniref:Ig-like domain-containing protein n=2 Tax=Hemibagrus wyckioides TaxID=337641 RepID=A0A9D3N6X4_9TELE|nr:hypothetical protein KOW79_018866 [Hemibagrus wyckioides]
MEARFVLFCLLAAAARAASPPKVKLQFDPPSLRLSSSQNASIQCCFINQSEVKLAWRQTVMISTNTSKLLVNESDTRVEFTSKAHPDKMCSNLSISNVVLNDTGLYQCAIIMSDNAVVYTPGTYLQVYEPIQMTLAISERSKNSIITAQGVLLLLFVLIPGIVLICKSKDLNKLEKKKSREEENIYEGLNLDDCNSTYHQIQRSLVQGPYQDVINNDEDDIQLEKP